MSLQQDISIENYDKYVNNNLENNLENKNSELFEYKKETIEDVIINVENSGEENTQHKIRAYIYFYKSKIAELNEDKNDELYQEKLDFLENEIQKLENFLKKEDGKKSTDLVIRPTNKVEKNKQYHELPNFFGNRTFENELFEAIKYFDGKSVRDLNALTQQYQSLKNDFLLTSKNNEEISTSNLQDKKSKIRKFTEDLQNQLTNEINPWLQYLAVYNRAIQAKPGGEYEASPEEFQSIAGLLNAGKQKYLEDAVAEEYLLKIEILLQTKQNIENQIKVNNQQLTVIEAQLNALLAQEEEMKKLQLMQEKEKKIKFLRFTQIRNKKIPSKNSKRFFRGADTPFRKEEYKISNELLNEINTTFKQAEEEEFLKCHIANETHEIDEFTYVYFDDLEIINHHYHEDSKNKEKRYALFNRESIPFIINGELVIKGSFEKKSETNRTLENIIIKKKFDIENVNFDMLRNSAIKKDFQLDNSGIATVENIYAENIELSNDSTINTFKNSQVFQNLTCHSSNTIELIQNITVHKNLKGEESNILEIKKVKILQDAELAKSNIETIEELEVQNLDIQKCQNLNTITNLTVHQNLYASLNMKKYIDTQIKNGNIKVSGEIIYTDQKSGEFYGAVFTNKNKRPEIHWNGLLKLSNKLYNEYKNSYSKIKAKYIFFENETNSHIVLENLEASDSITLEDVYIQEFKDIKSENNINIKDTKTKSITKLFAEYSIYSETLITNLFEKIETLSSVEINNSHIKKIFDIKSPNFYIQNMQNKGIILKDIKSDFLLINNTDVKLLKNSKRNKFKIRKLRINIANLETITSLNIQKLEIWEQVKIKNITDSIFHTTADLSSINTLYSLEQSTFKKNLILHKKYKPDNYDKSDKNTWMPKNINTNGLTIEGKILYQ